MRPPRRLRRPCFDWAQAPTVLITGHRRENFGSGIEQICRAIATLAEGFRTTVLLSGSLNPKVLVHVNRLLGGLSNVLLIAPQGYRNFVALMARCRLVPTGSGGVQEEAPSLGKPVLVMRDTTERPEGVAAGAALLTGPNAPAIVKHATRLLTDEAAYRSMATARDPYGDGHAARRIVERIRRYFDGESRTDGKAACVGGRWRPTGSDPTPPRARSPKCKHAVSPVPATPPARRGRLTGRRRCGDTIG